MNAIETEIRDIEIAGRIDREAVSVKGSLARRTAVSGEGDFSVARHRGDEAVRNFMYQRTVAIDIVDDAAGVDGEVKRTVELRLPGRRSVGSLGSAAGDGRDNS